MLPQHINFDAVLRDLLDDMATATDGWLHGSPRDEPSLLSRITERLGRERGVCDVGVDHPVEMLAEYYSLHRQDPNQTDRFGADLAVTIRIPETKLTKTAFFQLNITREHHATLQADQLREGAHFRGVHERSFVLAVDEQTLTYRIRPSRDCLWHFSDDQHTLRLDTSRWECLSEWVLEWFACKRGAPTLPNDSHPVEGMLDKYRLAVETDQYDTIIAANLPTDRIPAKAWFNYVFQRR